ncbi:MAG: hypothetical protein ACRCUT_09175 [Spirochaetota bacterium]
MKKLELTDVQYKILVQLVYLGNFMANATREPDDIIEAYEDFEQYIYSQAENFGCGALVEKESAVEGVYPTREFEEMMDEFVEQYDDNVFWDELLHRLTENEIISQYGASEVAKMSLVERIEKEQPIIKKYEDDFTAHGLDNLALKDK